jgi:pimeloyl-ACP methyl ester carboxylesterase
MSLTRRLAAICSIMGLVAAAGCGNGGDDEDPAAAAKPASRVKIDGKFDVGGHSLYMKCRGSASPTVVYLHGSITEADVVPHTNATQFLASLGDEHRVCVYDRRNLGRSDKVDEPQLPKDALRDLHELLGAADVEPPYVLLGASFGGLLAYLYANTYPGEVAGMVLLDSMFPDELALDPLFDPADRFKAFSAEDQNESLERISHYKVLKAARRYIGEEPDIPVTYLSSIPEGYDVNDYGIPAYDKKILGLQKAYVDRFSPGRYVRVDSPHFMEVAIPERITKELRRVIEATDAQG